MKQSKMIESRYSIEYIDPNSEKSSLKIGKFFIYTTLTISILAAVIALIYSNLPNNTAQLITHKVQKFVSSFNQPSLIIPVEKVIASDSTPMDTKVKNNEELIQKKLSAIKIEDEYKKEIERLSQENTSQHNEAVKQLSENQELTKNLDLLSSQLKEEILKSKQLKKEVVSLQDKNKSISSLLKITEEMANNYSDEINKLEQQEKVKIDKKTNIVIAPAVEEPLKTKEEVEPKVKTTMIKEKTSTPVKNIAPTIKSKKPMSQMDAIIAAMEASKNTSRNKEVDNTSIVE